jgi:SPX domain protein involved in polyphosphate accumulation
VIKSWLDRNVHAPWAAHYLDYARLKTQIKKIRAADDAAKERAKAAAGGGAVSAQKLDPAVAKCHDTFWCTLKSEVDRISEFYVEREKAVSGITAHGRD